MNYCEKCKRDLPEGKTCPVCGKPECQFLRYLPDDVQDMPAGYYCTKNPKLWDLIVPEQCKGCELCQK